MNTQYDVLIIDECSTVNNEDMKKVLKKAKFALLLLVGDVYQIESILFGNWFSIARIFIPKTSVFELANTFRSDDEKLLLLWDRIRKLEDDILEPMAKYGYTDRLNETIFERKYDDQIILCLNYDGLYGINNINRFLQSSNPNAPVQWGINVYKIGDPILFNETERFAPLIYNNMKGEIVGIKKEDQFIWFEIELEKIITEIQAQGYSFELLDEYGKNGNSIIRFSASKHPNTDEDMVDRDAVVPFQVAYAISIHKAQGLEYDSVKVVITDEVEERISHNTFYTAVTRAKKDLKIYWTPETEKKVLEKMTVRDNKKDAMLLKSLYGIK